MANSEPLQFIVESSEAVTARNAAMLIKTPDQEQVYLEAMRSNLDSLIATPSGTIMGLIAEQIMEQEIPQGSRLVYPTYGIIGRGMRETDREGFSDTLAGLYSELHFETSAPERMQKGVRLGDTGMQTVSGTRGNRANLDERYAGGMALTGYKSAVDIAEKSTNRHGSVEAIRASIPPLIERFHDVVRILTGINQKATSIPQTLFDGAT